MAFRREIDDRRGPEIADGSSDFRRVGNVASDEPVARVVLRLGQGVRIGRIGQLVEIEQAMRRGGQQMPHEGRADESGTAGDENTPFAARAGHLRGSNR